MISKIEKYQIQMHVLTLLDYQYSGARNKNNETPIESSFKSCGVFLFETTMHKIKPKVTGKFAV